jgi:hypothetical protein
MCLATALGLRMDNGPAFVPGKPPARANPVLGRGPDDPEPDLKSLRRQEGGVKWRHIHVPHTGRS